jgi:hypothetical protein
MGSPRLNVVFRLGQCDKENHGWREGPPLTVPGKVSIRWPGLHPPAKSDSKRKKNAALRRCPRAAHLRHWPIISDKPGTEYVGVYRAQSAARSEPRFPNGTDSPDRD